jgi:NAD(P)-dependent dehydrogenase (short-subunit alcohol dehydrogenase family)
LGTNKPGFDIFYKQLFFPLQLDIRDPAAVTAAVDQIEAQLGLPNVVIHNAAGTVTG